MPKRFLPVAVLAGSCLLLPAFALRAQEAATKAEPAQASDAKEKKDPIQQIKDEGILKALFRNLGYKQFGLD